MELEGGSDWRSVCVLLGGRDEINLNILLILMFIFERERERERESVSACISGGGAERERDKQNPKQAAHTVSTEPEAGLKITNPEIETRAKVRCLPD